MVASPSTQNTPAAVHRRHHVTTAGHGRQPMLFAHGFGCDQRMWRYVAPAFEPSYHTILFDYVGSGRSDRAAYDPARYRTLDGYAADVLDVVHALDLRDVVLVGHSVSATIGLLAAIRAPERFARLVLVSPSPCFVNDPPDYVGGFERADLEALLDLMDRNHLGWAAYLGPVVAGTAGRPAVAAELTDSFCATDPVIARQFAEATFFTDARAALPCVPVPALVLQCTADHLAPVSVGEYVARRLPHGTLRVLAATGHAPHLSAPE
ncbi:sigma factor SigB regulation protein RsbQ [Gemmatimonadetes bacterium T265]|nr:sigma factor SigB regulation protein RsbQ [Gemmatimonadetes bacterium T265]